jgi:hypothetical protein
MYKTKTFTEKAVAVLGDKYNYSFVHYKRFKK